MEQEISETSFEIPSIIEAISSSIDDSQFNFDELEQSGEASTTTESDQMEVDSNWSQPMPHQPDQYNQNYYPNYQQQQHHQQQNWNYQQGYSPYSQYGYMTPSPYNSYYMQSPPVDYHHNYAYNTNTMTNYEQQQQHHQQTYMFNGNQNAVINPPDTEYNCDICIRSFKSSSNLTRHFMSKTHLKRLESKRQHSKVTVIRAKKPRVNGIGSSFTDISKDEKAFLWQLDDEIFEFLKVYEQEKARNLVQKDLAIPTPPLSPNSRAMEERKVILNSEATNNSKLMKSESVIIIASSSENMQGSPLSVRSSSVDSIAKSPELRENDEKTENISECDNKFENLAPDSVKSETEASNYSNMDNMNSEIKESSIKTSKSNNPTSMHQKTENSSINISNNKIISNSSNGQSSPVNGYQNNSISSNLTSDFANSTQLTDDNCNNANQLSKQTYNFNQQTTNMEMTSSTYENRTNVTPNYENHNSPNTQLNHCTSNGFTLCNQNFKENGTNFQSSQAYSIDQTAFNTNINCNTDNSVIINSNNSSSVNMITNNGPGIKLPANKISFSNVSQHYQIVSSGHQTTTIPTSTSQNQASHVITTNKPATNRIIPINASQLTRTVTNKASGLKITSINPNITSNNGNPTTYTLTSSNSNIRYINASSLMTNSVKIQQISPNGIKNFKIVNNSHQALQNKVKIPHSSHNVQQNSVNGHCSPIYGPNSPRFENMSSQSVHNGAEQSEGTKVCTTSPSTNPDPQFSIPYSPSTPSSPTVLIQQETGEKYEIIFSDENFGGNVK